MKQKISRSGFHDAFVRMGREKNFSYDALNLLYDFFEDLEESTEEEIEFDVVAICCDYSESNIEELNRNYCGEAFGIFLNLEDAEEWLEEKTIVVGTTDDTIVFQNF